VEKESGKDANAA